MLEINASGKVPNVVEALERGGIVLAPLQHASWLDYVVDGICNVNLSVPTIGYLHRSGLGQSQRFALAHELGHIVLQKHRYVSSRKMQEDQADRFAAAFLIPKSDANYYFSPHMEIRHYAQLQQYWKAGISTMIIRAHQLGIIDTSRERSLNMQLNNYHARKSDSIDEDEEHPQLLQHMTRCVLGSCMEHCSREMYIQHVESIGVPFATVAYWCDWQDSVCEHFPVSCVK